MSKAGSYENPLVPNRKLLQIYSVMADARALDEHIVQLQRRLKANRRLESTRGQEAARVSTALELNPGDLVSDSQLNLVMDLISGSQSKTHINSLLNRVTEFHAGKIDGERLSAEGALARVMPWVEDPAHRVRMATGAALAFKTMKRGSVVVAYAAAWELGKREWRGIVTLAAKLELPIIFVVLHGSTKDKRFAVPLSAKVRSWGVPGIPVDANDAVALYRVTQESLGRIRGGGGPVLIECLTYRPGGKINAASADPLLQLEDFLLSRRVCTSAWIERARQRLAKTLSASEQ